MNARIARIQSAISRYLAQHPDAADSALGVQHWWLATLDFVPSSDEVSRALQGLADEQVLHREIVGGGTELYSARSSDDKADSIKGNERE